MDVLREVGGEAGVLLWQSYRNVMFWATAEGDERAKLFSAAASRKRLADVAAARLPHELVEPLSAIGGLLGAPTATPVQAVADACSAIARWAGEERNAATLLAFSQAAALASPRNALLALEVGGAARDHGDNARAETWFRHAIMISRQVGDWSSYARAYMALGNMAIQRGSFPTANRMHTKALRAARRKGLPPLQGRAAHNLFVVMTEMGRYPKAEEYARMAFRAYEPEDERIPKLAHDVAYLWMEQGHFARALEVFQALRPRVTTTAAERVTTVANIARAAGGVGDREEFRRAWVEINRLAKDADSRPTLPYGMLELARGAASLGEWDRAEQAAEQSIALAKELRQAKIMLSAETFLDAVRNDRKLKHSVVRAPDETAPETDAFAANLVRTLEMAGGR
jgi:tetratricopeptide (TPR) repeat protein